MATVSEPLAVGQGQSDLLSGTPRAHSIDRWIFVFMAVWFIAIALAGFIPSSLFKIAAVRAGERPPFPLVLHFHAVLSGSFLLLLLAQTWLMATGRGMLHKQLGLLGIAIAVALVVVGVILVPTTFHPVWEAAHSAMPGAAARFVGRDQFLLNNLLLQLRPGALFALFLAIGVAVRSRNPGLHKRMMILATAMALGAAISRIPLLPSTIPASPLSLDLYLLAAVSPMFVWDVVRNRRVHAAYSIWFGIWLPVSAATYLAWDTPWWGSIARQMMGV